MDSNKAKGDYGENVVLGYLAAKGYKIVTQNYRGGGGEIDIIVLDGDYIVFVEVKYRRGTSHGDGLEAVTPAKQKRLIKAAKHYLYNQNKWDCACRFDVVEVFGHELLEVKHVRDAFWA